MKRILSALFLAILAAGAFGLSSYTPALEAQATITPTTLSSAVLLTDSQIVVASATGFAANYTVVIDGEAMIVKSSYVSGTTIPVTRAVQGTAQQAHATSTPVYFGPSNYFSAYAPNPGPCTSTAEVALPRIVIGRTVAVYDCKGASSTTQTWQRYSIDGWPAYSYGQLSGRASGPVTYTSSTAITPQPGSVFVNGSTLAMTIIDPTTAQNGLTMCVIATNASAHTLTYTAGFNGGTTARDVATFGGAVGDNICFFANSGVWWVISTRNVTLG